VIRRRTLLLSVLVVAALSVVLLAVLYPLLTARAPYRSDGLGAFQVLGGPDEAWAFVERNIYEISSRGEHRCLKIGYTQEVVVIAPTGVKERIPISIPDSKAAESFHPNLSRVLREQGSLYLLASNRIHQWEGDHFRVLPPESYRAFLARHGLEKSTYPPAEPALDALTAADGWKHFIAKECPWNTPESFTWRGQRFEIATEGEGEGQRTRLRLRCQGPDHRWEAVLLEIDPASRKIP
jgi:hypothetical protein